MAEPGARELGVASVSVELSTGDSGGGNPAAPAPAPAPHLLGHKQHKEGLAPLPKLNKDGLGPEKTEASDAEDIHAARCISIASLVASIVVALLAFSIGISQEVVSLIGYGMESSLDGISSALVLWRFKKGKQREHEDQEAAARAQAERDARRERNSGVGIGITFVASAVLLFFMALFKLFLWDAADPVHEQEERSGAMASILLSLPSGIVFAVLAFKKFSLAKALGSQVLRKDALCSLLGAGLAVIAGTAAIIEELSGSDRGMAEVDAIASWIIALILGVEGVRTLKDNLGDTWAEAHRPMA
mmetsp:Transcript_57279/g.147314  ORF Transcript_57279/g.147314 Transcript_57279/m.147314 type:complete len:303 (-) Transcript_57279:245-1153(-)